MPAFVKKANMKRNKKRIERRNQRRRKLTQEKHTSVVQSDEFDIVGSLPQEIAQSIFARLNLTDLRSALRTCRKWKDLASDDYFWKHKCKLDNYPEVKETLRSKVYEKFIYKSENYWKRVYVYNEALHQNWRDFNFKETIFDFPSGGDPVVHYFDDEILIMTNQTKRVFVYNHSAEKFLQVFPIRANGYNVDIIRKTLNFVVYIHVVDKLLIIWCIDTGLCKLSMTLQDENMIRDVIIDKHLVAVLFGSGSCQIVNIFSGTVEHKTKIGNLNYCMCFHKGQVAFGTCNGVINIMNWADKMITTTLIYDTEIIVYRIMINCDYLISFSSNDICVWSLQKRTKLNVIVRGDQSNVHEYAVFSNSTTLLAINVNENMLEAWNFRDGTRQFTIVLDSNFTRTFLIMNDHYIFTKFRNSASDMKVWCKQTGKLVSNMSFDSMLIKPLATNTKLAYMSLNFYLGLHIQDFEKKIKLSQLNALYD